VSFFIKELVRDQAHDKPAGSEDPMPVANSRPEIGDVLQHVAGVDRVDAFVGKRQLFSVVCGVVEVHPYRMGQYRDCVFKGTAIPDINRDFTGHVGRKKAVLQFFREAAAGLTLDRPVLGHLAPADFRHRSFESSYCRFCAVSIALQAR
jgi:hypothetical protein